MFRREASFEAENNVKSRRQAPTFADLRESLRQRLSEMVSTHVTTQSHVARSIGVAQAHVSNFIYGKRGLSFYLADRLLAYTESNVAELLNSSNRRKPHKVR